MAGHEDDERKYKEQAEQVAQLNRQSLANMAEHYAELEYIAKTGIVITPRDIMLVQMAIYHVLAEVCYKGLAPHGDH